MNIIRSIKQSLKNHIKEHYKLDPLTSSTLEIKLNTNSKDKKQFGDLSTSAALILSKILKKPSQDVAQDIINTYKDEDIKKYIDNIDIAGLGFINIYLNNLAFNRLIQELFEQQQLFYIQDEKSYPRKNYSVEFVSTNPTGPMHLGHGRGGVIGDVLSNVLSFLGNKVIREFYINDAGKQIKKLGESFKIRCLQELGYELKLPEDGYCGQYLKDLAKQCIKEYENQDLVNFDNKFFEDYAKDHLLDQIKRTLKFYGILFDVWFSEQILHSDDTIERMLSFLQKKNYAYIKDNSLWFASTLFGDDKDRVLKKSNGELTYLSADIAYLQNKLNRGFDNIIMILGQDHHGYIGRLKAAIQALGYDKDKLNIIIYQIVTLKEKGKAIRMSKRAGRSVNLQEIIDTVGSDVARFFYLNKKDNAHLNFDIDLALKKTDENPVYYIQYAYVRIKSILKKAEDHKELENINNQDSQYLKSSEYTLLKKIASLESLLLTISSTYQTHLLSYYAIELAQLFHSYYGSNRIIDLNDVKTTRARLLLLRVMKNTFTLCFDLLGISTPEKM